ncbi:MAG: molybdopterin cofactor-binding domain-containing protein, partial [Bryobacteraceae bacterium]
MKRAISPGIQGDGVMTRDARRALGRAGFSRRDFLKTSGVLIVGFSAKSYAQRGPTPGSPALDRVDSWIAIAADGAVTAYSGKEELGQGIAVAQMQLVAEELAVPFERVNLIYCDTERTPDQAHTSGSQSHPANFNHANLAQAAATARQELLHLASIKLRVPVERLVASNGMVLMPGFPSKKVAYGELVGSRRFELAVDRNARRKPTSEWKILGRPIPRPDIPALVTGKFEFVHNVRVPGMLHGRVVRPPSPGATLANVDESSIRQIPGIVNIVIRKNFVGVVADKQWQAIQAASRLRVQWNAGAPLPNRANFYDELRHRTATRDTLLADSGDVDRKLAAAVTVLTASYFYPYQMHGSMGSSCAVADVRDGHATIWSPTQAVWYQRSTSATILGLKPENVRVIFRRGSGCYGLNGADTVTYDAAILSQAVAKPVRVQLSRKDEMAWENYGNAFAIEERAGLDAQGNIAAWDHESWSATLGNRPGPGTPGNVITGSLLGFPPEPFRPSPAHEPSGFDNGSNGVPSYLAAPVDGVDRGTGSIRSGRVLTHSVESPFFTGPLRSPARLQNTFAHECFMDELAARVKADPVHYRLKHMANLRLIDVLQTAAQAARWEHRASPNPVHGREISTGRGIASVAYEGSNGYSAMVIEAEVNRTTGTIAARRIFVATDCGPVSNPDGLRNH